MRAIANRYKRGELVGVGFECDFGGTRVHSIAWENAQVERLRDDPIFTEGLLIDQFDLGVACGGPLVINIPEFKNAAAQREAIEVARKMNREVVLVPGGHDFELIVSHTEPLKARIAELESELTVARALISFPSELTPVPLVASSEIIAESIAESSNTHDSVPTPEVIATHETIEPAVTETPVEPIQEPVVSVSELTAAPPSLALDTPVEAAPEVVPEVAEEVIEEVVEEAWKPTPGDSEAQIIRSYFKQFGIATPHKDVIAALSAFGIEVTSSQVLMAKKAIKQ